MISPRDALPIASNSLSPALVLASESPRRKALLAQAGIEPLAILPTTIDETPRRGELPRVYALRLAAEKLSAAASLWKGPPAILLAADTVVACGRRILPKAATDEDVRRCLALLSGRNHIVFTAIAAAPPNGKPRLRAVQTRVTFKRLDGEEFDAYIRSGEGIGKAGGYAIQGRAEVFVRQLGGSYSNVVGLPLFETLGLLKSCGWR